MLAMACLMPMQNDTWWHLRAGQEMWTRGMVMLTDEFSFTAYGAEWPNHGWGSEVIFYALYFVGGLPLLDVRGRMHGDGGGGSLCGDSRIVEWTRDSAWDFLRSP